VPDLVEDLSQCVCCEALTDLLYERKGDGLCQECFETPDVDDYDAPNVLPYKKCSECGNRSSCGNYNTDKQWLCEDCTPAEEAKPDACSCDACVVHKANPSANECGICEDALHDWVGIECLEMNDGSGDEMTVCCDCWQSNKATLKEEGWENQDGCDSDDE
jgi:hypothetical protein